MYETLGELIERLNQLKDECGGNIKVLLRKDSWSYDTIGSISIVDDEALKERFIIINE